MSAEQKKGPEEALGIIKVKNGYMITKGGERFWNTGYNELCVFTDFGEAVLHLGQNFNEKIKLAGRK